MTSRLLTAFTLLYTALVFYGSLMPWNLDWSWEVITEGFALVGEAIPFHASVHVSKIDLASNAILYAPLGFLVSSRVALGRQRSLRRSLLWAVAWGGLLSLAVEATQLLLPTRRTDLHDLLCNTIGALAGGLVGWHCGRKVWIGLRRNASLEVSEIPVSIAAVMMMVILAADTLYPFVPTLDVSTVMKSLRVTGGLGFSGGFAQHPWFHWLVLEVGVYAALAALLATWVAARNEVRWWYGGLWAFAFAAALELGKTFIVHRHTNLASFAAAGLGCALGLACFARLRGRLSPRAGLLLSTLLLATLVVYLEWEPFDFTWDPAAMRSKVPSGAAWLPLYHYAISGRGQQVALFIRTITLLAALTCCWQLWTGRSAISRATVIRSSFLAGGLGLFFELGQFPLPGRIPSMTDVFCFAAGGAIGALCAEVWRKRQRRGD
jgi:VanZ family protein